MIPCMCGCVLALAVSLDRMRCDWVRVRACTRHYAQPYPATRISVEDVNL